jgi:hypothetical protein
LRSGAAAADENIFSQGEGQACRETSRDFFRLVKAALVPPLPVQWYGHEHESADVDSDIRKIAFNKVGEGFRRATQAAEFQMVDQEFERGVVVRTCGAKEIRSVRVAYFFGGRQASAAARAKSVLKSGIFPKHDSHMTPAVRDSSQARHRGGRGFRGLVQCISCYNGENLDFFHGKPFQFFKEDHLFLVSRY